MDLNIREPRFAAHRTLFQILQGELDATSVKSLQCPDDPLTGEYLEHDWYKEDIAKIAAQANDVKHLIRQAVKCSPWILDEEKDDWTKEIVEANEDAALSLMILLLTNLRSITAPMDGPRLHTVVRRIAIASSCSPSDTGSAKDSQSLNKLVLVSFYAQNGDHWGMDLDDVALYAALPTVRRICVPHARTRYNEGDFNGWPADLPFSNVKEVYFFHATIILVDARKFATGFKGPCCFLQWWSDHSHCSPEDGNPAQWDFYEFSGGGFRSNATAGENGVLYSGIEPRSRKEVMDLRFPDLCEIHDPRTLIRHLLPEDEFSEWPDRFNAMLETEIFDWKTVERTSLP